MPTRTIDAINSRLDVYSPLVDLVVPNLLQLSTSGDLVERRRAHGRETWFYRCVSPYPPWPNRHLDRDLSCSRLYHALPISNVKGYLY